MEMEEDEVREPRNTGELLWWLMFEPLLTRAYSDKIKGWQNRLGVMLIPLLRIVVLSCLIYCLLLLLICSLELPQYFPNAFSSEITGAWSIHFTKNLILLIQSSVKGFLVGLVFGVVGGAAFGVAYGLAGGLAFGLAGSLTFGLVGGLVGSLMVRYVGIFAGGLAAGLGYSVARIFTGGLAFGWTASLVFFLMGGVVGGVEEGSVVGLMLMLSWLFFYFRIYRCCATKLW